MSSDSLQDFKPTEQRKDEQKVEESKYETAQEVYLDHGPQIPDKYGVDKLRLLVQDPTTITAQWELSGGTLQRFPRNPHPPQLKLGLTNLTRNQSFIQDIDPTGDNWWFKAEPDTEYVAEIGVLIDEGFLWLVKSNVVRTPRNAVSDIFDVEWMLVGEKFRRLLEVGGFEEKRYIAQQLGASLGAVAMGALSEALFSGALLSGQNIYGSLSAMAFGSGRTK